MSRLVVSNLSINRAELPFVTSVDGVQMASSAALPANRAMEVSSIASGLISLCQGAARCFEAGAVDKTLVEMQRGFLFLMSISDGSCLTVLAAPNCDTARVGHEMGSFVRRVGKYDIKHFGGGCVPEEIEDILLKNPSLQLCPGEILLDDR